MKTHLKYWLIILSSLFYLFGEAQIPNGYYNNAGGISGGQPLRLALHNIIKAHNSIGYSNLWPYFTNTDSKTNGKVWDIYSYKFSGAQPYEYTFSTNQCGTYNNEGDCYNREHTWPQSFFNSNEPARSDLHQVFPTDGFVNGKRADFPYGKVLSTTWTSLNGSKLGAGVGYPNYTGNIFEPIDSFKGDLARAYFYMSTRYMNEDAGWVNWEMANGSDLTSAAINILLQWHKDDPVSAKEIDRNNAIYTAQGNRNPFVDVPAYVECIWGNTSCAGVAIENINKIPVKLAYLNNQIKIPEQVVLNQVKLLNIFGQVIKQETTATNYFETPSLPDGYYVLLYFYNDQPFYFNFVKQ